MLDNEIQWFKKLDETLLKAVNFSLPYAVSHGKSIPIIFSLIVEINIYLLKHMNKV